MSKKPSNQHLLLPGETAWEIWTLTQNGESTLHSTHPVTKASEVTPIPQGTLNYLFPVKAFTAIPLHVNTDDTSLFPDLAAIHAERLGLRPDPMAGQLTDIFPITTSPEESTLLHIVLRNPTSDDLPKKSASTFDISPHSLPVSGDTLALWIELGQWVFAIHHNGKTIYAQATSSTGTSPDAYLIREIRIALAQLSIQGIHAQPTRAIIWSSHPDTDTELLSKNLKLPTEHAPRPSPVLPATASKLLPADVRAARRAAIKKRNTSLAIAAVAVLYLGAIGWFSYELWQTNSTTNKLLAQVQAIAPEGAAFALHNAKWDELSHAIDLNHNTTDILARIHRSIPPNSGLRLRTADISPDEIRLVGEAPQPQAVNQFSLNLSNNNDLATFTWQTPAPKQTNRGWEFVYSANTASITP